MNKADLIQRRKELRLARYKKMTKLERFDLIKRVASKYRWSQEEIEIAEVETQEMVDFFN